MVSHCGFCCFVLVFVCTGSSLLRSLSLAAESRGYALVEVPGLPTVVASVAVVHWLPAHGLSTCGSRACAAARRFQHSWHSGSEAMTQGLSCSAACGISSHQGLTLCPLHWQADSYPLYHLGSPHCGFDFHLLKEEGLWEHPVMCLWVICIFSL